MYKKITITKDAATSVASMNDTAREKIKDFLVSNGWTLDSTKSNGCNYCLYKNFASQENSDISDINKNKLSFPYFYNSGTMENVDVNGDYHLSISKPLHNSRVISITPAENPGTAFRSAASYSTSYYDFAGYGVDDSDITNLCSQVPSGYVDSGDRYDVPGTQKCIAGLDSSISISTNDYYYNINYFTDNQSANCFSGSCRLDEMTTELQIELFYFTDTNLQEEFYCVIRTDRLFGRIAPPNNLFYKTTGFCKIPGLPLIATGTMIESLNAKIRYNNSEKTFKTITDSNTGAVGLACYGCNYGQNCNISGSRGNSVFPNLSTVTNVTSEFNPRWDAPDETPYLWIHHAVVNYNSTYEDNYYSGTKDDITSVLSGWTYRRHTIKMFGPLISHFVLPYFKTTVNDVEHTVYSHVILYNPFGSYEFLYDQGCSSKTGTALLVPIQRQFQEEMTRIGPNHCRWYNVFYSVPEKVVSPQNDGTWKTYPFKRRSIQGYMNFLNSKFKSKWTNPITGATFNDPRVNWESSNDVSGNLCWITESTNQTSEITGQPIISDCYIGAEIDASGFEGFALDYSDYDEANVETIEL